MTMRAVGTGLRAAWLLARGRTDGLAAIAADPRDAARSFIAVVPAVPPVIAVRLAGWVVAGSVPNDAVHVVTLDVLIYLASWLAFAIVSIRLAEWLQRAALWPRFLIVYNWCNVVANLVLLAGMVPALLGVPSLIEQVTQLVIVGWSLWFGWFTVRMALETGPLVALCFVVVDQCIGAGFTVGGLSLLAH